jgi:hypothetical protein
VSGMDIVSLVIGVCCLLTAAFVPTSTNLRFVNLVFGLLNLAFAFHFIG